MLTPTSESRAGVGEYFSGIPLVTKLLILLNCTVFVFGVFSGRSVNDDALSAAAIFSRTYQLYRLLSYAFVHVSFLHLLVNMISLMQLGVVIENKSGSCHCFFLTALALLIIPCLYIFFEWCAFEVTQNAFYLRSGTVGFSGVIFMFAVIDIYLEPSATRLFFGIGVPTYIYPFLLLFALQLLIPKVSFIGHLSGIVSGFFVVLVSGFFRCCFQSESAVARVFENDDSCLYSNLKRIGYVPFNYDLGEVYLSTAYAPTMDGLQNCCEKCYLWILCSNGSQAYEEIPQSYEDIYPNENQQNNAKTDEVNVRAIRLAKFSRTGQK